MKDKILLISGCSHAAGSEIDGSEDSHYNRENSFGNLFARSMGFRPVNIAAGASNNQCISRTVLEWCNEFYNPDTMDLKVLIAWTESTRLDVPMNRSTWYEHWNTASDYVSKVSREYIKVNLGYKGLDTEEKDIIKNYHEFIIQNPVFIEILSANIVLQMQYFLKLHNIDYVMCNTMHMFGNFRHLDFYLELIDKNCYMNMRDNDNCFYWKYKNLGYENPKAKFWHHGEIPHQLFADELKKFYITRYEQ